MLKGMTNGLDPYTELARRYYNIPYTDVTPKQRAKVKAATYLLMYDACERTIEEFLQAGETMMQLTYGKGETIQ